MPKPTAPKTRNPNAATPGVSPSPRASDRAKAVAAARAAGSRPPKKTK